MGTSPSPFPHRPRRLVYLARQAIGPARPGPQDGCYREGRLGRFPLADGRPGKAPPKFATSPMGVAEVYEKYLDWCQKERESQTSAHYPKHVRTSVESLPDAHMPVAALAPIHVIE